MTVHTSEARTIAAAVSARGLRRHGSRHLTVDCHCHLAVPAAAEFVKPHYVPTNEPSVRFAAPETAAATKDMACRIHDQLTIATTRLADMDRLGIDVQVLSPAPPQYFYSCDPEVTAGSARIINDTIAATVAAHPDRFTGLGTLPMQVPELAVAEMRRAVGELGLRGVEIATNVAGRELSDLHFEPFFAAAEELGILVFLHPHGFTHGDRLRTNHLNNVVGNPLETTIALSHLIFGGVLDRHTGLKLVVAHGGGFLPAYAGRWDHAYRHRPDCQTCRRTPSAYLRDMHFDTVVFDHAQLAALIARVGADRVLMGSDYPFDMGDPDPAAFVAATPGLSGDALAQVLGLNAVALFGLDRPAIPSKEPQTA